MNLATLSVMVLWTAATLYAIAMVAYSVRLARAADDRILAKRGPADRLLEATAPRPSAAKALGIGRAAIVGGAVLHLVGVVLRGVDAGHPPWSNMYEYTISGVFAGVVVFLVVQRGRNVTYIAPAVAFFAVFGVVTALRLFYRDAVGLGPALDSYWLVIHVPIAVIASGIFGVSGIVSVTQIVKERKDRRGAANEAEGRAATASVGRIGGLLEAVPPPAILDSIAFRLNAVGFVLWTFTVVSGAMWAEEAWGRFWGWDPKEVWSFVIWVLYAAYLHARTTQGWMGQRAAWLAVAGFISIILNFTVVNLVLQGLHSYSGL